MPARPAKKISVAIVGAGNFANALAVALRAAGYAIDLIISRKTPASMERARQLAKEVGATAATTARVQIASDVVWFCVPDGAIVDAAKSLLKAADWKGRVALHSSGALTSDSLRDLRTRGAAVASVHPLMTFVRGSRPPLEGVSFAIEGDSRALRSAQTMIRDLRGRAFAIRKQDKEAYHAWGMFASPLFTALLAASENVAAAAGVRREAARQRMLPILQQTLANYARLGAPESFSGPIARGDVETVRKHLKVLRKVLGAREIYSALARVALNELPVKNREALRKVLRG